MKATILAPLIIMIILTSFYTLYLVQPIVNPSDTTYTPQNINGSLAINGTDTQYTQAGSEYAITITETLGLMAIIAVCEIVGTIAGINVLGSGLSDTSVRIIYKTMGLTILWTVLSVPNILLLLLIPYSLGMLFYLVISLIYAIGVIQTV